MTNHMNHKYSDEVAFLVSAQECSYEIKYAVEKYFVFHAQRSSTFLCYLLFE